MIPANSWWFISAAAALSYLVKLGGLSLPARLTDTRIMSAVSEYLPVALLGALIAVQTFTTGNHLQADARAAGLAAAVIALALRAPFIVVVLAAALVTALIRIT